MAKRRGVEAKITILAVVFGAISLLSLAIGIIAFIQPDFISLFVTPTSYFPLWLVPSALVVFGIIGLLTAAGLRYLHLWAWIIALILSLLALFSGLLELLEGAFVSPTVGIARAIIWVIVIAYLFLVLRRFRA